MTGREKAHITIVFAMIAALFAAMILTATCYGGSPEEAKALWVLLAKTATKGVLPAPDPEPVSDICENCNGRGWLGDGTEATKRTCPVCDGTGKRVTSTMPIVAWSQNESIEIVDAHQPEPLRHAVIEIRHQDFCQACDKLLATEPELLANGWHVTKKYAVNGIVPRATVWLNGKQTTITGFTTRGDFFDQVRQAIGEHCNQETQSLMHDQ